MNEVNMMLHLVLLILVSIDIRATQRNQALHAETQRELQALNDRLDVWVTRGTGIGD